MRILRGVVFRRLLIRTPIPTLSDLGDDRVGQVALLVDADVDGNGSPADACVDYTQVEIAHFVPEPGARVEVALHPRSCD